MIAKLLILSGSILIGISAYFYYLRFVPTRLTIDSYKPVKITAQETKVQPDEVKMTAQPVEIHIPDLNIHLPIIAQNITEETWETTKDGVSYLKTSPVPGHMGNSILYGHNWENLLGPLLRINRKNAIEVVYSDGSRQRFTVGYTATVSPDQVGILNQTDDQRLTIYTCTGFLDRKRFIAVAFPDGARFSQNTTK